MALINCSECQKQISDKASACPHCGAPVPPSPYPAPEAIIQPKLNTVATVSKKKRTHPITWMVLILIIAVAVWWFPKVQHEASLPQMPVEVKTRTAITGPGLVLLVKNTSNSYLTFIVALKNPTTGEERSYRLDAAPDVSVEVGHKEGWALASGDMLKITNNAYKSWEGSVP